MKSDLVVKQQLKTGEQWRERALWPCWQEGMWKRLTGGAGSFRLSAHRGILILGEAAVLVGLKVLISSHAFHQFADSTALPSSLLGEFKHILPQFLWQWNIEHWAIVGSVLKMRPMCLLEENWFSKTHLDEWQARLTRCRISWFWMRQIPRGVPELLHCAL